MTTTRRSFLRGTVVAAGGAMLSQAWPGPARAQSRAETLVVVQELGANSMDIHGVGVNRPSNGVNWNVYDRLVTFGTKRLGDGSLSYDYYAIKPELAESFTTSADDKSMTFKLRRDAVFHDGTPVTAADVKWSLDRAVSVPNTSKMQMKVGSMESPEQFVVVDDHTIRIDLPRPDRYALPDLAVVYPFIINSKVAKQHATAADPWALEWLKSNVAGGGAYRVESWAPGKEIVFARHDKWKSGALPQFKRVIFQDVPAAGNRRALLERGDADVAFDLLPKDVVSLGQSGRMKVVSTPMANTIQFIAMNNSLKPFDNKKVRQAVAYALPYEKMFQAAVFSRARRLYGAESAKPSSSEWPAVSPYKTDVARAKALLAEAGLPQGFETTFSYSTGTASIDEPVAILIQEALAPIGIKLMLNKVPGAQILTQLQKKELPIFVYQTAALLNNTDYFFRIFYHGSNGPWNFGSFVNPAMTKLIDDARFEHGHAKYDAMCRRMVEIAMDEVPIVPLWQPLLEVAMQKTVAGYTYMYHRQLDARTVTRA